MVRGDGVETFTGKHDVEEEIKEEEEAEKTAGEEDTSGDEGEFSSWGHSPQASFLGRSRSNSILHSLSMTSSMTEDHPTQTPPPEAEPAPSNLRRIQSALALFTAETSAPPTRNHRRTPSAQSIRPKYTKRFTGHMPMPELNMSSIKTPPPSPSIRRSNVSHPDITMLVEQWTSAGPANQTTMYKPHTYTKPLP